MSMKMKSVNLKLSNSGLIDDNYNRVYRNKLRSLIRVAKRNFCHRSFEACRGDMADTWKLIKDAVLQGTSNISIESLLADRVETADVPEMADIFNNYFVDVADKLKK